MNGYNQDEPNDDDKIIITYKKFKEMEKHFETLKNIMSKQEAEIARLRSEINFAVNFAWNDEDGCFTEDICHRLKLALAGGKDNG